MEDVVLSPFDVHSFFDSVYCQRDHKNLYYGLTSREPCIPLLFQTLPGSNPFTLRANNAESPETDELKRIADMKSILHSFVLSNVQKLNTKKYRCVLDTRVFSSFKATLLHIRDHHRHDFEQLIRVLLYDHEQDHLSFFFTKLFYSNLLYPSCSIPNPRSVSNLEYPSVLAPSFQPSTQKTQNVSNNAIAMLTQQKMEKLGLKKKQTGTKRRVVTPTPKTTPRNKKINEIQSVFTTKDLYELDLCLFPTAERSRDGPASAILNSSSPRSEIGSKVPTTPKNAKRKKKKQKTPEQPGKDEVKKTLDKITSEEASEQAELAKQKETKELQEKKKKKAAAELRAKQEQERKEKLKKEREEKLKQQKEEEKKRKQLEERQREAQRKQEEKKRQIELKERQKRIEKETEALFKVYGASITAELIEEVVCDLCTKLALRSIHEAKKLRAKQKQEEEERQNEMIRQQEIKQRKKEEREARRQFRNKEAEILWDSLIDDVIQFECKDVALEFINDRQQQIETQRKYNEMMMKQQYDDYYYMQQHPNVYHPDYQSIHNMGHPYGNPTYSGPPPGVNLSFQSLNETKTSSGGNLDSNSVPMIHHNPYTSTNNGSSFQPSVHNPQGITTANHSSPGYQGSSPPYSDYNSSNDRKQSIPVQQHPTSSMAQRDKSFFDFEAENEMEMPEHLQADIQNLIGDFDSDSSSFTSRNNNSTRFPSFSSFPVFNAPGESSTQSPEVSSMFQTNGNSCERFGINPLQRNFGVSGQSLRLPIVTPPKSAKPEDFGFTTELTVLLSNLPSDMTYQDISALLSLKFSESCYYGFLLNLLENECCCFIQLHNENDFATMLTLDGEIIRSNVIRVTPAQEHYNTGVSPSFLNAAPLQGRSVSPFDSHYSGAPSFGRKSFHVEPFVTDRENEFSLPPGLQGLGPQSIPTQNSAPFVASEKDFPAFPGPNTKDVNQGNAVPNFNSLQGAFSTPFSHSLYSNESKSANEMPSFFQTPTNEETFMPRFT